MKYLKRFNESIEEDLVDKLITYVSNNVLLYDMEYYIVSSSDSKSEIGIRNMMTKISFTFNGSNINIFVDSNTFSRIYYDYSQKVLFFKDLRVPGILCDNQWIEMLYLRVDGELTPVDENKQKFLYYQMYRLFKNMFNMVRLINASKGTNKFLTSECIQRMEEFEVNKGNRIDLISLNSLYDYYQMTFNEREIKEYLSKLDILYQ